MVILVLTDSSVDTVKGLGKALREVNLAPISGPEEGNVRYADLGPFLGFSTNDSSDIIIRDVYDTIWQEIEAAYLERVAARDQRLSTKFGRVLILGNSGIGKTASMNYYIMMAVRKGYPVLVETRAFRYYIDVGSDDAMREPVLPGGKLLGLRSDHKILLFHDHQPNAEPPLIDGGVFTVAPVSPDNGNKKEYSKHRCLELWMPLPSFHELKAMRSKLYPTMTGEEFRRRFDLVGRIPRHIFSPDFANVELQLENKIIAFGVKDFIASEMFLSGFIPQADFRGLSWWVVHVDVKHPLNRKVIIDWASPYVKNKVLEKQSRESVEVLREVSCQLLKNPPMEERPTGYYERWCVHSIAASKALQPCDANGVSTGTITFPSQSKVVLCSTVPSLETMLGSCGTVFYAGGVNPAFDAAAVYKGLDGTEPAQLLLFQVTIDKRHRDMKDYSDPASRVEESTSHEKDLIVPSYPRIAQSARAQGMQVRFIFIVPSALRFRLTKLQNSRPIPVEICEWNPCL